MKISLDWLTDFITFTEKDPAMIAQKVTASIAEVEAVELQGALLGNVVVGRVLSVKKHPNADRLSLCDVKTEQGTKHVVCGGTNLRQGMRVAFAHIGATVRWHGTEMVTLEKAKVRGEESEGMICAAEELDLGALFPEATGHSIIDLGDGEADVGTSLKEYLGLDDVVLHVDNHAITHRPDLFSHRGFARELVAVGLAQWKKTEAAQSPAFPPSPFPFGITVEQKKLVPRYEACLLEIDGIGETPAWMKRRLEATGWRSINLPIDITNYVMMEVGMPLHSFDAADIRGNVMMRKAKKGEKITTLDAVERELAPGALIMEDDDGIFDLLGIMGGLRGSTKETTRKVWLHSAIMDPVNTRKTVIAMGHRTDAATVYEKGVPATAAREGLLRAIALFQELVPGTRLASSPLSWGEDGTAKPITLSQKRMQSALGSPIPLTEAAAHLRSLGFGVEEKKNALKVTPPLWRLGDIHGEHDLVEEIGRVHGYNEIEPVLPSVEMKPPARDQRLHRMRDALKEATFFEILPLSLTGEAMLRKARLDPAGAVSLQNPLGEELRYTQISLLPSLLAHAQRNILNGGDVLRTFACEHVFRRGGEEHAELALLCAELSGENALRDDPFLLLKRDGATMLSVIGYTPQWKVMTSPPAFAHPGRCASILVQGTVVGILCEVHPTVREAFGLTRRVATTLLNVDALLGLKGAPLIARPFGTFPAITYDVTVKRAQKQSTEELLHALRKASPLLESVDVIDLFDGKPLEKGQFNLTLRFTYRAPDRTLTEQEVKTEQDKMAKMMA